MSAGFDARALGELLDGLARFSAPGRGVTRFAYDAAWRDAHAWLRGEARARGLAATPDAAGNLYFHPPAVAPGTGAAVHLVGSHLDTVRDGGRFDGAYGALAGLVLAAAHRDLPGPPVVGFVTCEEEQSRFNFPMLGARSLLGAVEAADLDRVHDDAGVTWRAARAEAEAAGCAAPLAASGPPVVPPFRPALALELHVEQGPVLEAEGAELGIVTRIAGYRRLRARLTGEARHSGTTPPARRRDALAAAAEIALACETLALEAGEPARVTAGNLRVSPGLYNVVPGAAELWLEVRHAEAPALAALADALASRAAAVAARRGVACALETVSGQDPVPLSAPLAAAAEALATERGLRHRGLASGAGHDSMELARAGVPTLMLFVPSADGISHAPEEFTPLPQLWTGVAFAGALLARLAQAPAR